MSERTIKLKDLVRELDLKVICGGDRLETEINGGYTSDLMSDVMGHAQKNNIWVTLQKHPNVVGVASLRMLAAIIIINGREPEEETVRKALEKDVTILTSELTAFELVGRLYQMGISGLH